MLYTTDGNLFMSTDPGVGVYTYSGHLRCTVVSGNSWTGLYAADGSINVVIVNESDVNTGLYHPCGAYRVISSSGSKGIYGASGAYRGGAGVASAAALLADAYTDVLAIVASDDSMVIKDTATPANIYSGTPGAKFTCTRAGATATYWGSDGVIHVAPANSLRRDFNPLLGGESGYLREPTRTNLCLQSNAFTNASWSAISVTVAEDIADGPMGAATMARVTEGASGAILRPAVAITVVDATTYTASWFLKRGNHDWIRVLVADGTPLTNGVQAWFNLSTGAKGTLGVRGTGWTATKHEIWDCGNGIYRVEITFVTAGTVLYTGIVSASADNSTTRADVGGGAGIGSLYYLDCTQVEAGGYATSFIPTTTASVQRPKDQIDLATTAFNAGASGHTLYEKFVCAQLTVENNTLVTLGKTDASAYSVLRSDTSTSKINGIHVNSGTQASPAPNVVLVVGQVHKAAFAVEAANYRAATDGTLSALDSAGTFGAPDTLMIGSFAGNSPGQSWLMELLVVPSRLTDAEIQTISTP